MAHFFLDALSSGGAALSPGAALFADAVVKGTVLLGSSALVAVALARSSAAVRHRLWFYSLVGLILLPPASFFMPGLRIAILPPVPERAPERAAVRLSEISAQEQADPSPISADEQQARPRTSYLPPRPSGPFVARSSRVVRPVPPAPAPSAKVPPWFVWPGPMSLILIVWAIGFSGVLLPMVIGVLGNELRRRRSRRIADGVWPRLLAEIRAQAPLRRSVELRQSGEMPIPVTWGVVRPVILLPAEAEGWDEPLCRSVLLHELAHIRRFDVASQLVGRLATALYWFHPLAWYALSRLRAECEYAADDCLIHAGQRRSHYAEQLLAVARSARRLRTSSTVAMARGNCLEERLRVLFDDEHSHRPLSHRAAAALLAGAFLIVGTLAVLHPARARASFPTASPKASTAAKPTKTAQSVTGQVVGSGSSAPVAGADVYLLRKSGGTTILPTHPFKEKADANGHFTFTHVPLGSYRVWAESGNRVSHLEELAGEPVEVKSSSAPAPVNLRLTEACRFRVTVRSKATGRPIPKAAISFLWADIERTFLTDAGGVALVEGVRPREKVFQVRADGYAAETLTVAATQPGTTTDVGFTLGPGGQIRGTVRDSDGRPIRFARVVLRLPDNRSVLPQDNLKTDAWGRFFFDNVPLGQTLEVSVGRQNRWTKKTVLLSAERTQVLVDLRFDKVPESGSIVVRVTGPDHKPIAGARVSNPGSSSQWWRRAITDEKGECRIDNVYDFVGRYRLFVRAKRCAPQEVAFQPEPAASPGHVDVALGPGHAIRGRVMLTDGKPASGVRVYFDRGEQLWTTGGETRTDDEGRFSLDSLPAGCTFTIYPPPGYAPFRDQTLALDRKTEVIVTLDTVALVKGRVVDEATGKPAVPYRIRLMGSPNFRQGEPWPMLDARLGQEGRVILQPEGQFEFGDLPPGAPMQLMISAKGYVDQSLDRVIARPEGQFKPLEVRLHKIDPRDFRTVSGRLVGDQGKPVVGAEVRVWTTATRPNDAIHYPFNWTMIENGQLEQSPRCQQYLAAVTNGNGEFHFTNVRVAPFAELAYWGKEIAPGRETVDVSANSAAAVQLAPQATTAAQLVIEVDRRAWSNAGEIALSAAADSRVFDYRLERLPRHEHRIVFEGLPAGRMNVLLQDDGHDVGNSTTRYETLTSRNVVLRPGETTTVHFDKP